jgi:hypothetical protein
MSEKAQPQYLAPKTYVSQKYPILWNMYISVFKTRQLQWVKAGHRSYVMSVGSLYYGFHIIVRFARIYCV